MIPKGLPASRGSQRGYRIQGDTGDPKEAVGFKGIPGAIGFKGIPRSYQIQGDPKGLPDPGIGVESKGFQIKHLNKERKKEGKNCWGKKMTCIEQPGF